MEDQKHRVEDGQHIYLTSFASADASCLLASSKGDHRGHGEGIHCWLQGRRPGDMHGEDLLNKHSSITDSFCEHRQPLDPVVRNNHICRCANSSLQQ